MQKTVDRSETERRMANNDLWFMLGDVELPVMQNMFVISYQIRGTLKTRSNLEVYLTFIMVSEH